jgi:hypothetical protein
MCISLTGHRGTYPTPVSGAEKIEAKRAVGKPLLAIHFRKYLLFLHPCRFRSLVSLHPCMTPSLTTTTTQVSCLQGGRVEKKVHRREAIRPVGDGDVLTAGLTAWQPHLRACPHHDVRGAAMGRGAGAPSPALWNGACFAQNEASIELTPGAKNGSGTDTGGTVMQLKVRPCCSLPPCHWI